jgi:hypothetical protein
MPGLQPVVKGLDASIRATVPGLGYGREVGKGVLRVTRTREGH